VAFTPNEANSEMGYGRRFQTQPTIHSMLFLTTTDPKHFTTLETSIGLNSQTVNMVPQPANTPITNFPWPRNTGKRHCARERDIPPEIAAPYTSCW